MAGYHSDVDEFGDAYDTVGVLIPCEFCGEQYPEDVIIEHQTGCDLGVFDFGHAVPERRAQDEVERVHPNTIQPSIDVRPNIHMPTVAGKSSNVAPVESLRAFENLKVNNAEHYINTEPTKRPQYNLTAAVQKPVIHKDKVLETNTKSKDIISKSGNTGAAPLSKLDNFDVFSHCDTNDDDMDMKDIIISDDEDDEVESIESLWKRAAVILKERLLLNDGIPAKNKNNNAKHQDYTNKNKNVEKKFEWEW